MGYTWIIWALVFQIHAKEHLGDRKPILEKHPPHKNAIYDKYSSDSIVEVIQNVMDAAYIGRMDDEDLNVVMRENPDNNDRIIVIHRNDDEDKDAGALAKEEKELDMDHEPHKVVVNEIKGHDSGAGSVISISNNKRDEEGKQLVKVEDMISSKKEKLMSKEFLIIAVLILITWMLEIFAKEKHYYFLQMPNIAASIAMLVGEILMTLPLDVSYLKDYLDFNDDLFFMCLLPLIIFDSAFGLSLQRREGTILAILYFAILGTLLSFVIVGSLIFIFWNLIPLNPNIKVTVKGSFSFAALISATDPVSVLSLFKNVSANPFLEALVTGESLMNDVLSISLYRTITRSRATTIAEAFLSFCFLFFFAIIVGVAIGCSAALLTRSSKVREHKHVQLALVLIFPYIAYLLSESIGSSGIVAILFSGITINRYCVGNLNADMRSSIKDLIGALSLIAETVAFLLLGLGVFFVDIDTQDWVLAGIVSVVVVTGARFLSIWITTHCYMYLHEADVSKPIQGGLALCGLRGAVALGLAKHARHDYGQGIGCLILASALWYSLFTVIFVGPILPFALTKLGVMGGDSDYEKFDDCLQKNSLIDYLFIRMDRRLERALRGDKTPTVENLDEVELH